MSNYLKYVTQVVRKNCQNLVLKKSFSYSKTKSQNANIELIILLIAGKVTNLVVVSRSSLLSTSKNKRVSNEYNISPLDKYLQLSNSITGTLHSCPLYKGNQTCIDLKSFDLLKQKIFDTQVFSLFLNSFHLLT